MIEPRLGNSVLQTATTREGQMARIVVQADDEQTVLLDERSIKPEHISDRHSARQLLERVEWAVRDEGRRRKRRRRRITSPRRSALASTFD